MIIVGIITLIALIFAAGSFVGARLRQSAIDAVNLVARQAEASINKSAEEAKVAIDVTVAADWKKAKTKKELEDEINK